MLTVHGYHSGQKPCLDLGQDVLDTPAATLCADNAGVLWIDLEDPTPEEEAKVFQKFLPIHPLSLEDIVYPRENAGRIHFPKVEEFPDYLFIVANPLSAKLLDWAHGLTTAPGTHGRLASQLSVLLTRRVLVTHHREPLGCIKALHEFLHRHTEYVSRGPDYLLHLILDSLVDQYAVALDHFDDVLEKVEKRVLQDPNQKQLTSLLHLKRSIVRLRKTLIQEREVLARLARGEFELVAEREMAYYRNVYDHLVRYTELIESTREMATDLLQMHMSATANRMNQIMKVLTMISTIILPMTLITGVYGMNVKIPEYQWDYGYAYVLGLMAASATAALAFFRWRGWF